MTGLVVWIRATIAATAAIFLGYPGDRCGHARVIAVAEPSPGR